MGLQELYQSVVNLNHEERVDLAKGALKDIYAELDRLGVDDDDQGTFIISLIKLFVSADKNCSEEEYQLINDIYNTDMSYQDFFDMTNHGSDPEFVKITDEIVDKFRDEAKQQICLLGLAILASDEVITVEEKKLFERILA